MPSLAVPHSLSFFHFIRHKARLMINIWSFRCLVLFDFFCNHQKQTDRYLTATWSELDTTLQLTWSRSPFRGVWLANSQFLSLFNKFNTFIMCLLGTNHTWQKEVSFKSRITKFKFWKFSGILELTGLVRKRRQVAVVRVGRHRLWHHGSLFDGVCLVPLCGLLNS